MQASDWWQRSMGQHYGRHRSRSTYVGALFTRHDQSIAHDFRWSKMGHDGIGHCMARLSSHQPVPTLSILINVADADVLLALRFLSDVDEAEYRSLEGGMSTQPGVAQRRLAQSVTKLVHGEAGLASAVRASEYLFGGEIESLERPGIALHLCRRPKPNGKQRFANPGLEYCRCASIRRLRRVKAKLGARRKWRRSTSIIADVSPSTEFSP